MKVLAAGLVAMSVTLSIPVRETATVPVVDAAGAWTMDGAVAEAAAHDGVVTITGRTAGRTRIVVESAGGVSELEVEVVGTDGEQRNGEARTGTIELSTGRKSVTYSAVDGLALFEGDIVLGTLAELDRPRDPAAEAIAITGSRFRWPNGTIPFTIDPAMPDKARVLDAIAHWEASTTCRFAPRTKESDFVTFRAGTGCSSSVGRRGGQQFVTLAGDCGKGNAIHEIGHAAGLWHEHGREDRDRFVRINFDKVRKDSFHNFNQHVTDGDDAGPYDYASIMHYPRNAYSVDGSDTVVPLERSAQVGQRAALSAGDIAAANALCGSRAEPGGKRRAVR